MRRPGSGPAKRHGFRGIGHYVAPSSGAAAPALFPAFTSGTFSRASEASYHTTAAAIAWAAVDALRAEDRGDTYGPQYLFEGSRTNLVQNSEALNATGWTVGGTFAADQTTAPDGGSDADKLTSTGAGQTAGRLLYNTGGTSTPLTASIWVKQGTQGNKVSVRAGSANNTDYTPTASWQRIFHTYTGGSAVNEILVAWNLWGGSGGTGVTGDNHFFWGAQLEGERFPSSYIRTSGATATRAADVLTFTAGQIPSWFWNAPWTCRAWPRWANTDLASGDVFTLFSLGDVNNSVRVRHNGTDIRVEAVQGGTVKASSPAVGAKARHALWTIKVDPAAGVVSLDGVAGSAGTAWTWASATVRVGGVVSDAAEWRGRIEAPVAA